MKAPKHKIIVRADNMYNYYVKHGNLTLYVDPMFKRGHRKVRVADVVSIPQELESWCNVVPEVKEGDRIYFHYNALEEFNIIPDQQGLWVIDYTEIFCAVRDGKIIMIGGKILSEALFDEDIQEVEVDGVMTRVRLTKSGLVSEVNPEHNLRKARLAHIGTPLAGEEPVPIQPGDVFYYVNNADFKNTIEGKEYFVMNQEDIIAIEN